MENIIYKFEKKKKYYDSCGSVFSKMQFVVNYLNESFLCLYVCACVIFFNDVMKRLLLAELQDPKGRYQHVKSENLSFCES